MSTVYADAETAVAEIRRGSMLIVTDNEDRENEGDFIMAAACAGPDAVNFMALHGRGLICQAITEDRAAALELPPMAPRNTSAHTTAFTVSVDARQGTTTGISAFDRAVTIKTLIDPQAKPEDLCRPGHIFPLAARRGGLLERQGHTEAAMELARLAGRGPSGILCEILDTDGRMARLPRLEEIAQEHRLRIVTVETLVRYLETMPRLGLARRIAESRLPTQGGNFRVYLYENPGKAEQPHIALVSEKPFDPQNALARIHSECLTGDVLMSCRCDCGGQLAEAMGRIAQEGGALIYLRQEGRGIGLTEKIRAYALQDQGLDTVEANLSLGHEADERDYTAAAAILRDLNISGVRLMTNNPAKLAALAAAGLRVAERVAVEIKPVEENRDYLAVKKVRLGHQLTYV